MVKPFFLWFSAILAANLVTYTLVRIDISLEMRAAYDRAAEELFRGHR